MHTHISSTLKLVTERYKYRFVYYEIIFLVYDKYNFKLYKERQPPLKFPYRKRGLIRVYHIFFLQNDRHHQVLRSTREYAKFVGLHRNFVNVPLS